MYRIALIAPILVAACSNDGADGTDPVAPVEPVEAPPLAAPFAVPNQRGDREGHNPLGFAGSGSGLFVGDNSNERFPEGEGHQLLLTFEVPAEAAGAERAVLRSNALTVRGTPFVDSSHPLVDPVTYDEFGPHLFELEADGEAVACGRPETDRVACDVTVLAAGTDGRIRLRLRFERSADDDGSQDPRCSSSPTRTPTNRTSSRSNCPDRLARRPGAARSAGLHWVRFRSVDMVAT